MANTIKSPSQKWDSKAHNILILDCIKKAIPAMTSAQAADILARLECSGLGGNSSAFGQARTRFNTGGDDLVKPSDAESLKALQARYDAIADSKS